MKHNDHESRSVPILCPGPQCASRARAKAEKPVQEETHSTYYTPAEPEPSAREACFRRDRGPVSKELRHAGWRPWSDRARVRDRVVAGTSFEPKKGRGVRALAP